MIDDKESLGVKVTICVKKIKSLDNSRMQKKSLAEWRNKGKWGGGGGGVNPPNPCYREGTVGEEVGLLIEQKSGNSPASANRERGKRRGGRTTVEWVKYANSKKMGDRCCSTSSGKTTKTLGPQVVRGT